MNRTQAAKRSYRHSIIEDDLILRAQPDEGLPPSAVAPGVRKSGSSLPAGIRIKKEGSPAGFHRSLQTPESQELKDLDQAVAEIGRRATFGFAALLELPLLLAMNGKL